RRIPAAIRRPSAVERNAIMGDARRVGAAAPPCGSRPVHHGATTPPATRGGGPERHDENRSPPHGITVPSRGRVNSTGGAWGGGGCDGGCGPAVRPGGPSQT